jgi:hypothetical protein
MEFINEPLPAWCIARHIEAARTRPYHKNDNGYAEQKNYDAVCKTVGYFRFDTAEECDAVAMRCPAEGYRRLCPLYKLPDALVPSGCQRATGGRSLPEGLRKGAEDAL